jgi:hypothetical protein
MALDELHARRLSTLAVLMDDALRRVEAILRSLEESREDSQRRIPDVSIIQGREKMARMHDRLLEALRTFQVKIHRPEPQQLLAAEFATLWVILENARPERMKGYGREFHAKDKLEWTRMIEALMDDLEQIRSTLLSESRSVESASD